MRNTSFLSLKGKIRCADDRTIKHLDKSKFIVANSEERKIKNCGRLESERVQILSSMPRDFGL